MCLIYKTPLNFFQHFVDGAPSKEYPDPVFAETSEKTTVQRKRARPLPTKRPFEPRKKKSKTGSSV